MNSEKVSETLRRYIERNVFPEYSQNDAGHRLPHIEYVIRRSLKFAESVPGINCDMVYTVAAYHDIAHHVDARHHEELSAERLRQDTGLRDFFSAEQIETMAEAVREHRATLVEEPHSIYGKIVSSADRNTDADNAIWRCYQYRLAHNPEYSLDENIEESRQHLIRCFGREGFAINKIYFPDPEYDRYCRQIVNLTDDAESFKQHFLEVIQGHGK